MTERERHFRPYACAGLAAFAAFALSAYATGQPDTPPEPPADAPALMGDGTVRLDFKGVPLGTFLEFLSREAGFVINKETSVEGTVDVVSHQPLNRDEVVQLLTTVLNAQGYTALRHGRVLTIVPKDEASKRDLPVRTGNEPEEIERSDEMLTQIIPVRHADAEQLLVNLQPLLPEYASASANKSSNAILLTDTQANVRRMVEIVRALDNSISGISEIRVFQLEKASAEDTADLINELFETQQVGDERMDPRRFFGRGGPFGGGGDDNGGGESPAREAVSRVIAVADERTNSVAVAAPQDLMPAIEEVVRDLESSEETLNEIRVFALSYADCEEMADLVNQLFEENGGQQSRQMGAMAMRFFRGRGPGAPQEQASSGGGAVTARADVRTNSIIVSAPEGYMPTIAPMIEELDRDPARDKRIYVYDLNNADAESVAAIVQGMFGGSGAARPAARGNTAPARNTQNTGAARTGPNAGAQSRF